MATHRPRDWHVLDLDTDPTPGDPHRVRALAKHLHDFADDVGKVLRDIKGMAGEDAILQWAGKTADAFTEKFEDAPDKLKKLKKSYEMAGDALSAYWPDLERAQSLADKALVKGREAQADLSSAKSRLSSADSWVERVGKEAGKYKDAPGGNVPEPDRDKVKAATRNASSAEKAQKSAQGDVNSAQSALEAAKKMAEDAHKMREEAAGTAKRKIDEASDAGIPNRKWWEEVGDWVTDNWDTIVEVCKVVVAVVGVIAMIVGGPILAAIVIVAGAIVLADTLSKYAKGQAGLMDVAFAAMDCVPGMKGITTAAKLGKGMRGLKGGLKGFKTARTALKDGAKGAYSRVKSKVKGCGDPVDVATGQMFLEEIDLSLPGTLPLLFTRRVASGYRSGGWFGPTWTSTLDQRLEVDEDGVVLVTEDGMLLAYPPPEGPHVPVLPESGPRRPLIRLGNGGYQVTDPLTGVCSRFAPPADDVALLTRMSDRNNNTIDFAYDAAGVPTAIRHSGGYHLKLTVEGERVVALVLADAGSDGRDLTVKRYGYTDGNLTTVTNSSGIPTRFSYDERLRITSWEDTNHSRYEYSYDDQDRCTAQRGMAGHLANTFTYDVLDAAWPDCRVTVVATADGATFRFVVDERCLVVAEVDPLGGTAVTAYGVDQHVVATTDQLGHVTRFSNDELGQPTEILWPDGTSMQASYNDLHLVSKVVLSDGATWRYAYDERGNRTKIVDPAGATSGCLYNASGHLAALVDELGHATTVRCDAAGLPLEVTDPLGGTTRWERDAFGRPTAVTDELGGTTSLDWSIEGDILRRVTPDGSCETWTYDGEGNCTGYTDQLGQTSRFDYTHFDLLSARTGPDGVRYEFSYDASLRLTEVVNPLGQSWRYTFDAAGRLVSEKDFDGREAVYTHNAAGRLVSLTNALRQTITFERDVFGRITRRNAAGRVSTFTYDAGGRLSEAVSPDSTVTMVRDRHGRVTSETVDGRELRYAYDAVGRCTSRTTPTCALSTWSYDAAGRRARLVTSGRTVEFAHDSAGRELSRRVGGVVLANAFDSMGRLTGQSVTMSGGHDPVQSRLYTYRADGHLTRIDDQLSGTRSFDLDAAGRVTAVHAANWTESYAYDATGNQVSASWPREHPSQEATGPRTYEGGGVTRAGSVRYEHDGLGRITLRQKSRLSRKPDTWHYEWDAEDRLASVRTPDGTHWRYTYDALGRRSAKMRLAGDGATVVERIEFVWDGTTLCEQISSSAEFPHPVVLTWDHQEWQPIAQTERVMRTEECQEEIDARFFAIVTDIVGAPCELIGETGDIAWRARSSLWGVTAWDARSEAYTPLRFPGQYFDPETGLHYNYFRHYDPETARYLSSDPLGLEPALNPVVYVRNPHAWTDPLGLAPKSCTEMPSHKDAPSRNAAFRLAKRDLGIPMNQHPDELNKVPMTDRTGRQIMDDNGRPVMTREYVYKREDGSTVIIQDHSAGHDFREGGVGNQERHFNVRPGENPRTGKVPGTAQHYEY